MRITRLKLRNYKSFDEPPELTFTSGFNVIAGQNSTGKTALLEALSLTFGPSPHRSLRTLPTRDAILDPVSSADISVTLNRDELLGILATVGQRYFMALPTYPSDFANSFAYTNNDPQNVRNFVQHVLSREGHTFTGLLKRGTALSGTFWLCLQMGCISRRLQVQITLPSAHFGSTANGTPMTLDRHRPG
jgi:AAA domain-containing protein